MAIKSCIVLLLVMVSWSYSAFADERHMPTLSGSSGYELVEGVVDLVKSESRVLRTVGVKPVDVGRILAFRPGSQTRYVLVSDLNRILGTWFDFLTLVPTSEMVDRVTEELYFVLIRATGSSILQTDVTAQSIKDLIRAKVKPHRVRSEKSCMSLLLRMRDPGVYLN